MARTIVGLFDTFSQAQQAVHELTNIGISRDHISMIANDARGEYAREVGTTSTSEGAGVGAVSGGLLGGVVGLLVGLGALAIPGIGPVIAAGPLAAALGTAGATAAVGAGVGALSGGLLGALIGAGIPEDEANLYAEGVRRGGTLVTVYSDEMMTSRVSDILRRNGAVDMDTRGAEWRTGGWQRFDPQADPYSRE